MAAPAPVSDPCPDLPAIGARIRDLRRKANLTLQTVADQAGISVGFLSQLERDKATPSLGTLAGIAATFGVDLETFVGSPRPEAGLSRKEGRIRRPASGSDLFYEQLSTHLPGGTLTSLLIHLPEGCSTEPSRHSGEESIFVLEGRVRQRLGDQWFDLAPGDNMHFMGETPHSFTNPGPGVARLLWTGTTPRLHGRPPTRR